MRLKAIPETVELRKKDGDAFLEKTELIVLVEWKARRAKTYNSSYGEAASSNSALQVREITRKAFSEFDTKKDGISAAIKTLQELIGVPLLMATLLLSMYDPNRVPYFSDELDRYVDWGAPKKEGRRATKNVSHTMKEYHYVYERVQQIRERVKKESGKEVRAVDIELVAHFIGLTAADTTLRDKDPNATAVAVAKEERPRKKRKTKAEIYEEEHPRGSEKDTFRHIHNCVDKGRGASPTYDEWGWEMDYEKCLQWEKPMSVASLRPTMSKMKKQDSYFEKRRKESKRMAELMNDDIGDDSASDFSHMNASIKEEAWKDRVRTDLGQKTYQVPIETFEKWYKNGFRAKKGEFDLENMSPERKKRYSDMRVGCALRR
ncbi:hypothetical protein EG329_012208 [Mollisiaceae sp. DMI_Dod_QoI]|nr:hypothetical protein EG329_012208 [Helotiales sp. DMI_Dod_QoI]